MGILDLGPVSATALYLGLMTFIMLGLKLYVGLARAKHKVPPGDFSNQEFGRATRVQMNAVEDAPALMVGLLALGVVGADVRLIHFAGIALVLGRILHAFGLASTGGASFGRGAGTLGVLLAYLAIGGALLVHAFGGLS